MALQVLHFQASKPGVVLHDLQATEKTPAMKGSGAQSLGVAQARPRD
jgi:hypothetical protein